MIGEDNATVAMAPHGSEERMALLRPARFTKETPSNQGSEAFL